MDEVFNGMVRTRIYMSSEQAKALRKQLEELEVPWDE